MKSPDTIPLIRTALKEDAARLDITSRLTVPRDHSSVARIVCRQTAILCGIGIAADVFRQLDPTARIRQSAGDGARVTKGSPVMTIKANTRKILAGERTALNFLAYLSGIATLTRAFVDKVQKYPCRILDTRKTIPGMRPLAKYAVKCGGGDNHRRDLQEMIMIKDNHRRILCASSTLSSEIQHIRKRSKKKIQVEVDTLAELKDVLEGHPDLILLDNMSIANLRRAVTLTHKYYQNQPGHRPLLEASGGIQLNNVASIAATGVDRISIGALTHSVPAVDLTMEFI